MFKALRRFLGDGSRAVTGTGDAGASDLAAKFDSSESGCIEPAIIIAESELDLADLPETAGTFARQIVRDAVKNELELPILPELGHAVRRKTLDPPSSAADLTLIIQTDIAITTKLIQVTRSPFYAGYEPVQSLNAAITRIGMTTVRDIVTGLTLKQIFLTQQPLLASLFHDIGDLVITKYANALSTDELSDDALSGAIQHLSPQLGALMLRRWNLGEEFVFSALHADNFNRESEAVVRLVDLVQVAQLHLLSGIHRMPIASFSEAPAVKKLGLALNDAGNGVAILSDARHDVETVRAALVI